MSYQDQRLRLEALNTDPAVVHLGHVAIIAACADLEHKELTSSTFADSGSGSMR